MKEALSTRLDTFSTSRDDLLGGFTKVRARTEYLAAPLSPEDACIQSMEDTSPAKWHLAHSTWFFESFILKQFDKEYKEFDPNFNYLFNSYYNSIGERHPRPKRGMLSRPSLDEVKRYREHVTRSVVSALPHLADDVWHRVEPLLELGINHEQQHQELLLTDIKHALWQNPLRPAYRDDLIIPAGVKPDQGWLSIDEGLYEIGHKADGFAFDNESPRHRVYLQDVKLRKSLVTNGEYLDFMREGGYDDPLLWLAAGHDAKTQQGWTSPLYWERHEERWFTFTLGGLQPLDLDHPVTHISFYEADAFARWAGCRLATEAELEIGSASVLIEAGFSEENILHPNNANVVLGQCWQWTSSDYNAYPGYAPAAGAVGEYNGKFMSNQMVLRGGSCATPRDHYRNTYRNFFPHTARWQFSGIRLAK
jgi:ergothioneine biosynthesis protein EgtB